MNTYKIEPLKCFCCQQKEFTLKHYCALMHGKTITCSMCGVQYQLNNQTIESAEIMMVGVDHSIS